MANDIQEVGFTMPSGKVVYVPSADSVKYKLCGSPQCKSVHVFLMDQVGQPIAECTVNRPMLEDIKELLNHLRP